MSLCVSAVTVAVSAQLHLQCRFCDTSQNHNAVQCWQLQLSLTQRQPTALRPSMLFTLQVSAEPCACIVVTSSTVTLSLCINSSSNCHNTNTQHCCWLCVTSPQCCYTYCTTLFCGSCGVTVTRHIATSISTTTSTDNCSTDFIAPFANLFVGACKTDLQWHEYTTTAYWGFLTRMVYPKHNI